MDTGKSGSGASPGGRLYEVDWLRAFAMLTIFLFHCARFFNYEDWHVKNNELSSSLSVFVGVVSQWIMPLFFVLSAFASFGALERRTGGRFIAERFKRLIVPFVFGTFVVIAPLQVWIERVSHSEFTGTFLEFYPRYFDGFYAFGGNFAWMGLHLWYLQMLFLFSVIVLPLFLYMRKDGMKECLAGLASFCDRGVRMAVFALPVAVSEALVSFQPEGIGMRKFGGWSVVTYLVFFVMGYIVASSPGFMLSMQRQRRRLLAFAVAAIVTLNLMYFGNGLWALSIPDEAEPFLRAVSSWCTLAAILGFGGRYLRFKNPVLAYANEAVLPFYILHQTVIVAVGFYISGWGSGVAVKYILISAVSFFFIVAFYHLVIRRFNALRFLFGMRPMRKLPS